ncbi:hypothetical protein CPER28S_01526 [Cellulomonas persica]
MPSAARARRGRAGCSARSCVRASRRRASFEDPRPPKFAQLVGLVITTLGVVGGLLGVTWAVPLAAAFALVAAFLNAVFGLCLGCEMYLLGVRLRTRSA